MSEEGFDSILISSPTSPIVVGGSRMILDKEEKRLGGRGREKERKTNKARAVLLPRSVVSKAVPLSKRTSITSEQFLEKKKSAFGLVWLDLIQ